MRGKAHVNAMSRIPAVVRDHVLTDLEVCWTLDARALLTRLCSASSRTMKSVSCSGDIRCSLMRCWRQVHFLRGLCGACC